MVTEVKLYSYEKRKIMTTLYTYLHHRERERERERERHARTHTHTHTEGDSSIGGRHKINNYKACSESLMEVKLDGTDPVPACSAIAAVPLDMLSVTFWL
jgi:hypothetical protein